MEGTSENLTDLGHLAARLEAAIFAAGGPGLLARLRRVLQLSPGQIDALVGQINASLVEQGRPYEIVAVAGGYQFRTRREWSDFIGELQPERKLKLSASALDTLAVVAYKQPITRPEIEDLRSVDCGAVLKSLTDRRLIRVIGRRDAPGKPALYGTTPYFLEAFGLRALHELPQLSEIAAQMAAEGTAVDHTPQPDGPEVTNGHASGSHENGAAETAGLEAAAALPEVFEEEGDLVLADLDPEDLDGANAEEIGAAEAVGFAPSAADEERDADAASVEDEAVDAAAADVDAIADAAAVQSAGPEIDVTAAEGDEPGPDLDEEEESDDPTPRTDDT